MYKIGIDEAGRGPWLGGIVACSLAFNPSNLPQNDFLEKLNDSKKLSKTQRESLYKEIIKMSSLKNPKVFFGVGIVDNYLIDEINVKQANKEAMRRSLVELLRKIKPEFSENGQAEYISGVFIDGNDNYEFEELEKKPIYVISGDSKIKEISAASIVAKVFRDKLLTTYSSLYPNLGIENHKGYGTKKHKESLSNKRDIVGIHRLSYKPVKEALEKKEKLLLHICCGPDATVPIMDLKDKFEVVCFWYDPNIQPKKEYEKRYEEFVKVCKIEGVSYIKGEYDVVNFFKEIKGLEHTPERGEKCEKCYDMRLRRSALEARKLGIKYWTSTLNTSPHKDLEKMFKLGDKYSISNLQENNPNIEKDNLEFLKIAFRKMEVLGEV